MHPTAPLRRLIRDRDRGALAGWSPIAGRYKVSPEDFRVAELPRYRPSGTGDHLLASIEKRGISTMVMIEGLAKTLGRKTRDFGYAGLKDAVAVTQQWISLEHVDAAALHTAIEEHPALTLLESGQHGNKLRPGHLAGNQFTLVVRPFEGSPVFDAATLANAKLGLESLSRLGVPHGFGSQRFGKRGANLAKGLSILAGDPKHTARRMKKHLLRLILSAVQSEVFNRVLNARIDDYETVNTGDVAYLHDRGACFVVEDEATEQARAQAFEVSATGPLPGPSAMATSGAMQRIEADALKALQLTTEHFADLPFGLCRGERRALRVPLKDASAALTSDGALEFEFSLPPGAYATGVLDELIADAAAEPPRMEDSAAGITPPPA